MLPCRHQAGAAAELAEVLGGDSNETVAALTAKGEEALSKLPAEDVQKVIDEGHGHPPRVIPHPRSRMPPPPPHLTKTCFV